MPVKKCQKGGKPGYKVGNKGACVTGKGARGKVERMNRAVQAKKHSKK